MTNAEKIIKNKMGLIKLAEQLGNVSQACKVVGYVRDSFYRFKELYEEQGEEGLRELSRRKPNPKNRVDPAIEEAVLAIALENPVLGQLRVSNTLKQEGIFVSPGGVRSIWLRHGLETGKTLASKGLMNPQISYGEDVVSRIVAASKSPSGRSQTAIPAHRSAQSARR